MEPNDRREFSEWMSEDACNLRALLINNGGLRTIEAEQVLKLWRSNRTKETELKNLRSLYEKRIAFIGFLEAENKELRAKMIDLTEKLRAVIEQAHAKLTEAGIGDTGTSVVKRIASLTDQRDKFAEALLLIDDANSDPQIHDGASMATADYEKYNEAVQLAKEITNE